MLIPARQFLSDVIRSIRISLLEIQSEYQGTVLGILWIPLSALLFSVMLALVFHHGDRSVAQFLLYVLAGYTLWSFIARSISDSTAIIQKRFDFAIHCGLDLRGTFFKALVDRLCEYGLNVLILFIAAALLQPDFLSPRLALFVPFLVLIAVTSLAVSYVVNVVTVLVPDMGNLIRASVRFLFFVSPVFWTADHVGAGDLRQILRTWNPASYFLDLPRQAVGISALRVDDWAVAAAVTAVLAALAAACYAWSHSFIRNIR